MSAVVEATSAQWEAYYAARAKALRAKAGVYRMEGAAARLHPMDTSADPGASWDSMATDCDRMAAELDPGVEW